MAQSCCFIVQIAVASVKGRCWIGCNGKSNWTKTGIGSKFICDLVLLLHFAFTSPFPMYTSFRKNGFYSVIQSYFIIRDFLQNCQKSILVYQVLISLSLYVYNTVPKSPCRISKWSTSPSEGFSLAIQTIYILEM